MVERRTWIGGSSVAWKRIRLSVLCFQLSGGEKDMDRWILSRLEANYIVYFVFSAEWWREGHGSLDPQSPGSELDCLFCVFS